MTYRSGIGCHDDLFDEEPHDRFTVRFKRIWRMPRELHERRNMCNKALTLCVLQVLREFLNKQNCQYRDSPLEIDCTRTPTLDSHASALPLRWERSLEANLAIPGSALRTSFTTRSCKLLSMTLVIAPVYQIYDTHFPLGTATSLTLLAAASARRHSTTSHLASSSSSSSSPSSAAVEKTRTSSATCGRKINGQCFAANVRSVFAFSSARSAVLSRARRSRGTSD